MLFTLRSCTIAVGLASSWAGLAATAPKFGTIVTFNKTNGARPSGGMVQGFDGLLYSTTAGLSGVHKIPGTIFSTTPGGAIQTVHKLYGYSLSGLLLLPSGDFYGTTTGLPHGPTGVFEITPSRTLDWLYQACGGACDAGVNFYSPLIQASDGNLYGTTADGGAHSSGTIFRITPSGTLTTIYDFCSQPNCADGRHSYAPLIQASDGNLYGTTATGGNQQSDSPCQNDDGCGTVFRITLDGSFTTLYSFCGQTSCPDSGGPMAGLLQASDGYLYGTTVGADPNGFVPGTVFRMSMSGQLSTFYTFNSLPNGEDGHWPMAGLIQATDGNLYGTTEEGGTYFAGTVFQLTLGGVLTPLHQFCVSGKKCSAPGGYPFDPLFQATDGNFYGTTYGYVRPHFGTVFSLSMGLGPFVRAVPNSGAAGATVTILGTNLTGVTGVSFSGTPAASFSVNSTNSAITATVPAGAATGEISVTTATQTLKSDVPFTVTP